MLVKFTPTGWKESILIDSNKIHMEGNIVLLPHSETRAEDYCYVDVATLAYLENAKLHEGMRRVKTDNIYGWSNGNYYDDKGILCVVVETDDGFVKAYEYTNTQFIPYEMEEQK